MTYSEINGREEKREKMSYDKEKTEENDGNMARTSLNIARKMNSD
jgi:hypothetical protein